MFCAGEVVLDDGEVEMLFKGRCKLFCQSSEDKVWKERGVGMLTLRRPRGDGGKPYIVFTTESGRCGRVQSLRSRPFLNLLLVTTCAMTHGHLIMLSQSCLNPRCQVPTGNHL